jgi:hypothetical protein
VNFFVINRFAGSPNLVGGLSHILSTTINNCDTLFLLVPNTVRSETCFFNPYIDAFQLDAGPYGTYPSQPMKTWNAHRFINMVADSLNVNSSVLTSFNKDTNTSFCLGLDVYTQAGVKTFPGNLFVGERSSFFIGIPFSIDNDYQGGMSSPSSSIVFKVSGTGLANNNEVHRHAPAVAQWNVNWYALFLIDGSLMIKPDASGEAARVIYSDRSIV